MIRYSIRDPIRWAPRILRQCKKLIHCSAGKKKSVWHYSRQLILPTHCWSTYVASGESVTMTLSLLKCVHTYTNTSFLVKTEYSYCSDVSRSYFYVYNIISCNISSPTEQSTTSIRIHYIVISTQPVCGVSSKYLPPIRFRYENMISDI